MVIGRSGGVDRRHGRVRAARRQRSASVGRPGCLAGQAQCRARRGRRALSGGDPRRHRMMDARSPPVVRQRPDHVERHGGRLRSRCSDINPPTMRHRSALSQVAVAPDVLADVENLGNTTVVPGRRCPPVGSRVGRVDRSPTAPRSYSMSSARSPGSRIGSLRVCPAVDADSSLRMRPSSSERGGRDRHSAARATAYSSPTAATGAWRPCNDEAHARLRLPRCARASHRSRRDRCESCGAALGLHLPSRSMVALHGGATTIDGESLGALHAGRPAGL